MISICLITIKTIPEIEGRIEELNKHTSGDYELILIQNPNGGVAENRNKALQQSKGDIIIFVDDDLYGYFNGWMDILIEKLKEDKNILMVGPRLLNSDGHTQKTISKNDDVVTDYIRVDFIPGACMAYRKNNLLFNEQYKNWGMEDVEFQIELKKQNPNGKILLCNQVKLFHINEMKRHLDFGIQNKELFKRKWGFLIE